MSPTRVLFLQRLLLTSSVVMAAQAAAPTVEAAPGVCSRSSRAPSLCSGPTERMVSVQPLAGRNGERVRREVARVVRGRRYEVTTDIPPASGTGQYFTWARDLGLTAFVVGELVNVSRSRQRVTFLVWSGHNGSVVGRWTVSAPGSKLPATVARNFWRNLGPALRRARAPRVWNAPMSPGPTLRIDASSDRDPKIRGRRI